MARATHFALIFTGKDFSECGPAGLDGFENRCEGASRWEEHDAVLDEFAPFALESLVIRNCGYRRRDWLPVYGRCPSLRFYAASQTEYRLCAEPVVCIRDTFIVGDVKYFYEKGSAPLLTHVYEARRGVVATAGPWDARARAELLDQIGSEDFMVANHSELEQRSVGVRWSSFHGRA